MNNPEVSLFFPEPIFKYKFEDYESFNKDLKHIFMNFRKKVIWTNKIK